MSIMDTYQSPFLERYSSKEMLYIFSKEFRIRTWRKLWVALAQEQKNLGLPIQEKQIQQMLQYQDQVNYEEAQKEEKKVKHEVMSHILAYGMQCPDAKKIIHLGATSAYVLDNTELIQIKEGLKLVQKQLVQLIQSLSQFCIQYKNLATLSYTHFQRAQPTTVGKRASLWLQDLIYDYRDLKFQLDSIPFLGVKGATGTQNAFLKLFDGDTKKVLELDEKITERMGFSVRAKVTGQIYTRKIDYRCISILSGIAQSSHKFSNDLRLLQNLGELAEPFGKEQIGSSAMVYKQNPILAERITGISRYVINLCQNTAFTAASQWLERTIDDSANKRLSIPQGFLATDAILRLYQHIISNIQVHKKVIEKHLKQDIPFMITEDLLMEGVQKGLDRQELHQKLRDHSVEAHRYLREDGEENPLIHRITNDPNIPFSAEEIKDLINKTHFTGLASLQVEKFVQEEVQPILKQEKELLEVSHSDPIEI